MRHRVIQLGESPDRVYNVGGMGIENIKRLKLLNKEEFLSAYLYVKEMKKSFIKFDDNGNEKMEFDECVNALRHYGLTQLNQEILADLFSFFSGKKNYLCLEEYIELCVFVSKIVGNFQSLERNQVKTIGENSTITINLSQLMNDFVCLGLRFQRTIN